MILLRAWRACSKGGAPMLLHAVSSGRAVDWMGARQSCSRRSTGPLLAVLFEQLGAVVRPDGA